MAQTANQGRYAASSQRTGVVLPLVARITIRRVGRKGHEPPVRDPHPISETVLRSPTNLPEWRMIMNTTRLPLPLELTKPVLLAGDLDTQFRTGLAEYDPHTQVCNGG